MKIYLASFSFIMALYWYSGSVYLFERSFTNVCLLAIALVVSVIPYLWWSANKEYFK